MTMISRNAYSFDLAGPKFADPAFDWVVFQNPYGPGTWPKPLGRAIGKSVAQLHGKALSFGTGAGLLMCAVVEEAERRGVYAPTLRLGIEALASPELAGPWQSLVLRDPGAFGPADATYALVRFRPIFTGDHAIESAQNLKGGRS